MTRLAGAAATVLLLLTVAGCGSGSHPQVPQEGAQGLVDLRDIGRLRSLFNTRSGEPRLILLVSPT